MAYKCLFMDNGVYTAQDVNNAISGIVTGGVSGYPFGGNALSDLNEAMAELIGSGVQFLGNSCLVINDSGTYKIQEGTCFMQDGSQIIFDSEGYIIDHNDGTHEYVYLERDVLHNTINVVVSETSGANDTIPLAEIQQDGSVLDRRHFAKSKVSLMAEPENIGIVKRIQFLLEKNSTYSYDLGFDGWEYLIFRSGYEMRYLNVIKLIDGGATNSFPVINNANTSSSYYTYDYRVTVTRRGSILEFENSSNSKITYDIEFELR